MCIGSIWVWAERRAKPPIMKERINSGSDRFFQEEAEREKEIVIGEGPRLDKPSAMPNHAAELAGYSTT
jgi:hypothetical protein